MLPVPRGSGGAHREGANPARQPGAPHHGGLPASRVGQARRDSQALGRESGLWPRRVHSRRNLRRPAQARSAQAQCLRRQLSLRTLCLSRPQGTFFKSYLKA